MNSPAAVALMAMTAGFLVTAVALAINRAPGWGHLRSVSVIAATGAVYALCDLAAYLPVPDGVVVWASRVSLLTASLQAIAWLAYMAAIDGRRLYRWERWLGAVVLLAGVLPMAGPVVLTGEVRHHAWLGLTYADAITTPVGDVCFAIYTAGVLLPLVRFATRWRKGLPGASTHTVGLSFLALASLNDSMVASHVSNGPYLLDLGFLAVAFAVSGSLVRDFIASARRLEMLSVKLEHLVDARTEELSQANQALARAEKLAAIGQLAAGVAHEINNPAAVVQANLEYLQDAVREGGALPEDGAASLADSLNAVQRIARIVRQLLDAGRVAGGREGRLAAFPLAEVVRRAVTSVVTATGADLELRADVPADLHALGQAHLFEQVLINLLVNACHAVRETDRGGQVLVRAERRGDRVAITVKDNGPGISPEAQRRLFEPFFTTRRVGHGTGLGLAVSLGLMRAQGGNITLVGSSKDGTTLCAELPWAPAAAKAPEVAEPPASSRALRLLLVDDEPAVLEGLGRALRGSCSVETADGVEVALAKIRARPDDFDAVVCDVVMPDGGGERLYGELVAQHPALAAKTLFLTGGAPGDDARRFLDQHADRLLLKPLDSATLYSMVERMLPRDQPVIGTASR